MTEGLYDLSVQANIDDDVYDNTSLCFLIDKLIIAAGRTKSRLMENPALRQSIRMAFAIIYTMFMTNDH